MGKKIQATEAITTALRAGLGDPEADPSKFSIFEADLVSTAPISKAGFFKNAVLSAGTLAEMVTVLNTEGGARPLQVMHNTNELPVGKVFSGQLRELPTGDTQMSGLFAISNIESKLVENVDNGTIDEVSVGVLTKSAFCSECNFDYFSDDASMENFWSMTCDAGHEIGKDGVHVRLVGLDTFSELSLVNRGAAKKAKILPRMKQSMGQEKLDKLAASGGMPFEARVLQASVKLTEVKKPVTGDDTMDNKELIDKVASLSAEVTKAQLAADGKDAQITTLTAQLKEATDKVASLEATSKDVTAVTEKATKAETQLTEATAKVLPHAKAALVASGAADATPPEGLVAMLSMIEEKGLKLHQVVGSTGAEGGPQGADKAAELAEARRKEAFRVTK